MAVRAALERLLGRLGAEVEAEMLDYAATVLEDAEDEDALEQARELLAEACPRFGAIAACEQRAALLEAAQARTKRALRWGAAVYRALF
jgi:ribosomal protein L12E/L44/L45/RPP1/RPP2